MWDSNAAALSGDRQMLAWDMRGHARSDAPAASAMYGVEQALGDMRALLDISVEAELPARLVEAYPEMR